MDMKEKEPHKRPPNISSVDFNMLLGDDIESTFSVNDYAKNRADELYEILTKIKDTMKLDEVLKFVNLSLFTDAHVEPPHSLVVALFLAIKRLDIKTREMYCRKLLELARLIDKDRITKSLAPKFFGDLRGPSYWIDFMDDNGDELSTGPHLFAVVFLWFHCIDVIEFADSEVKINLENFENNKVYLTEIANFAISLCEQVH